MSAAAIAPSRHPVTDEVRRRLTGCLAGQAPKDEANDPDGRTIAVRDGERRWSYRYDEHGDLTRIEHDGGRATEYLYDAERRLRLVRHPDGATTAYRYDAADRLTRVEDRGHAVAVDFDAHDRVVALRHDAELLFTYSYDDEGRVAEAVAPGVRTRHHHDAEGRVVRVEQVVDGALAAVDLGYDAAGRLSRVAPTGGPAVGYAWDGLGRPAGATCGDLFVASFEYRDGERAVRTTLGNGVVEQARADRIDGRPLQRTVSAAGRTLLHRVLRYDDAGRIVDDGRRRHAYDEHGRLCGTRDERGGWSYGYDRHGNLSDVQAVGEGRTGLAMRFAEDRLLGVDGEAHGATYDARGALTGLVLGGRAWAWRYDAAGRLVQVRRGTEVLAALRYDHKGRLVVAAWAAQGAPTGTAGAERYVYGPGDELLAVTDLAGVPVRVPVRSPWGVHAELLGPAGVAGTGGSIRYLHHDDHGTLRLATGPDARVLAEYDYDPFGCPLRPVPADAPTPVFGGRGLVPGTGLYWFGARWYHPQLRRFLTRDAWTAGPDDERLTHPVFPGRRQVLARSEQLPDWLRRPRLRDAYTFCGNDPVNRVDPNGHWSFGGVVLALIGIVWTLPNTLLGLILEITCLVGEVIRWVAWLVTGGRATWEVPGFDAAASGRLNALALVFRGGWLGSFPSLLGITFGNVFFVYGQWEKRPEYSGPGEILPRAYYGTVRLARTHALYEHELRHTNQYGWLGPFFHLGLPIFGFYQWDVILHGYREAWTERDARDHSEGPDAPSSVVATGTGVTALALSRRWVYWRAAGAGTVQVLWAGADGVLHAAASASSTRPWEFTAEFSATPGDAVEVASSGGARPLPATLLSTAGLLIATTVTAAPDGRARVAVPARSPALTTPVELAFWPLPHDLPPAAYPVDGLPQGAALWSAPGGANDALTVVENGPAPVPATVRPATRALRVSGTTEAAATAVRVHLLDTAGQPVPLTPDAAGQPRSSVAATLAAPSGGQRGFDAAIEVSAPAAAFGQVLLAVVVDTPTGPIIEAFTGHLCGVQVTLVDDPAPSRPGPIRGESDEVVVVDFDASPQSSQPLLAGQARARRMVRYRIANETRPLTAGGAPVLRPRMPLWMGEVHLVGVGRADLEDLLHRRADRRGTPGGSPAGPLTTRISFRWRLRLSWDGPDASASAFAAPFPRPNQRHAYTLDLPRVPVQVTAVLSYDERGRLTDPHGSTAPADPAGALPGALQPAPQPAPYPVAGRRLPQVRVGQLRSWGREPGAVQLLSLVVEFQPSVENSTGAEAIRGGDGDLSVDDLRLDGTPVDPGVVASGGPAPPAGSPLLRAPTFRVHGDNPPAAQVEDVVRVLVREYVTAHAAATHLAPLTQDCWVETVLRILRLESGGRYRQFDERGAGRRRFARQGSAWWFGTENAMPLFGPPHGYGIGQLDLFSSPQRGANDDEVWNWVDNLRFAVLVVLADKAVAAWMHIGAHSPTPLDQATRAAFQRETVRRYNGGREFTWTGTAWAIEPATSWLDDHDHSKGPDPRLVYPNLVLGTTVAYFHDADGNPNQADGANTVFAYPPPIPFVAAQYGPGSGP